ncbi:MAG: hypothetical protein LBL71_00375 [Endomicrobium sp.]|jgi:tyrosyl-tRNA synthetase|nr:hypothetical protein [Endomicrobium sp.]
MYGKIMPISDEAMLIYAHLLTDFDLSIEGGFDMTGDRKALKMKLAREIVSQLYNSDAALKA